jgi:hypothetical protein
MEILMLQLERNSETLLLRTAQRLEISSGRRKKSLITRLGRSARDASPAVRFFGAEVKTWRGEQPLWLTFWVYGVAVSGVIALLYGAAIYKASPVLQEVLLVVLAVYTGWVLISLWRRTEGAIRLSEVIARFLIVPWAANVALVLAFMQIELLPQLMTFASP